MSAARAVVRPGKWSNRTKDWPKVGLSYTEPLPNAYYDWAADNLPIGEITSWSALNNGATLNSDGGIGNAPLVVDSGNRRAVRLDGVTNRMRLTFSDVPVEHTLLTVYRFVAFRPGDAVLYGHNDSKGAAMATSTAMNTLSLYSAGKYVIPNPQIPGDTNWHVLIGVVNGNSSAFRQDDKDTVGSLVGEKREGLTIGFSQISPAQGGNLRANIEYARVAVLPPLTAGERALTYERLRRQYSL